MLPLSALRKLLVKHFLEMRWHSLVLVIASYIISSWLLLWVCDEKALTTNAEFIYWIIVTASTVGYGDLSPVTTPGKYAVAFYIIPLGLSLFALAVGRLAAFVSFQWRKGVQGLKSLNYENHVLLIGWNEARTLQLIRLLLREIEYQDQTQKIALCVRADIENPMPEDIGFVKVESFSHDLDMQRAAIDKASCIIIDNPDDDMTMTTGLYCANRNPEAHIIAYFKDDQLGHLLKKHCPNIECVPSVAVEMMAKSAVDPGSSYLHHQLLDVDHGMTQYSMRFSGQTALGVHVLFSAFKEKYGVTLIGVSSNGSESVVLNPDLGLQIEPGDTVYYIADERIHGIDWSGFHV